jgi:hypothetical protein
VAPSGRTGKVALGAGTAIGASVLFARGADAATFTVTNLSDAYSGDCEPSDCSIVQAVYAANDAPGDDLITFQSGLSGTIDLGPMHDSLRVNDAGLEVRGPGAGVITITGGATRIFELYGFDTPGEQVLISGLTLAGADAGGGGGGAITSSAGIDEAADLTIAGAVLTGNRASSGGAVHVTDGALRIVDSTISGNVSEGGDGGAIYLDSAGSVVIENTAVTDNRAGSLAAFEFGETGGGLRASDIAGDLTIRNSTFSANAAFYGGAMHIAEVDGDVAIENTTISGNRAIYDGGGIYFGYLYDDHTATIRNSTITANSAGSNPGAYTGPYGGGGVFLYDDSEDTTEPITENGPVNISSTIIAANTVAGPNVAGPDLRSETFADGFNVGFSLIGDPSAATITEAPAGSNLLGVDPLLGPLAENGGPTQTHLPGLTSPALEAGIANGLATDQRGEPRSFDASNLANRSGSDATDIGAVELTAAGACKGKAATVLFAPGQKIKGSGQKDVVVGTSGKDKIATKGGKDTVCAGAGNDNVKGGGGKDNLSGQGGKDTLKGGGGKDKLSGGPGRDKLRGGPGKDKLKGGGGKDSEVQ